MSLLFVAYFTEYGEPKTGLSPTIRIRDLSDNSLVITDEAMSEVGDGFYKYTYSAADNTKNYAGRAYGGAGQPTGEKYVPCVGEVTGAVQDIFADTNELQTNQGNWATATGFLPDTEDGSSFSAIPDMATATNQATIIGYLDTEIAAILEDTGTTIPALIAALNDLSSAEIQAAITGIINLTAGKVDVGKINGVSVEGTGVEGDPWGPV
jgi:hypothetical protein